MACGGCKKKGSKRTYSLTCLDCNEVFNIDTSGRVIKIGDKHYVKGVDRILIKHKKCGSTRCKTN